MKKDTGGAMDVAERNKLLGRIGRAIGGEAALVLFDLIEHFPERACLIDDKMWARVDPGAYLKLGMEPHRYSECVAALIGVAYIDQITGTLKKRGLYYRINFEALEAFKGMAANLTEGTVLGDKLLRKIAKDNRTADGIKYEIIRDGEPG
jgi:hypothetical protein